MNQPDSAPGARLAIDGQIFDVVIVGGGISGASAAQHLAAAGYAVLLVEKDDFAAGATSRSSRLLHNGLRYLAPPRRLLDFIRKPQTFFAGVAMARLSSQVGDEFVRDSPHQVRTTRLLIPLFDSSPFRGWQVDLGSAFLKLIGRRQVPLRYQRTSASAARDLPFVRWLADPERLRGVAAIDDQQFVAPERLCIECILDARRLGALALNYVAAERIRRAGAHWEVVLRSAEGSTAIVKAVVLLNLAGVWVDRVNELSAGNKPVARRIVGVKGVSIAVQLPPECEGVGIAGTTAEGDAIMCVPWGKLHYLGPTETVYDGDIEDVRPEPQEIDLLLHDISAFLPGLAVDRSKILYAWAGVRPITYDATRAKGRRMPFSVIHRLADEGLPNMLTMTWAAVMFHRGAARRLVREVARLTPPTRPPQPLRIGPDAYPRSGGTPLVPSRPDIGRADIVRAVTEEGARDLVGVLFRRTGLGWTTSLSARQVREAADLIAPALGWDAAEIDRQVAAYLAHVARHHLPTASSWSA